MNTTKTSTENLISAIETFPSEWSLCPVGIKKNPINNDWQKGISRDELIKILINGYDGINKDGEAYHVPQNKITGIGLITGELSGYLLALDIDGPKADKLSKKLGGIPHTVSWTSGKDGRYQCLLFVSPEYQEVMQKVTRKVLETGTKGEQLEIRYNASQSVLPPSQHPETEGYKWINSIENTPIAEVPIWVIEKILEGENKPSNPDQLPINFNQLDEPIPLIQCLSVEHRNLIKSGLGYNCGRDDAAFKIVSDAIGCEQRLQYLGINFDGNARDLLEEFHNNSDKKEFTDKDINRIYRSAQKSNPTPCLDDDKLENCYKAWLKNQGKKLIGNNSKTSHQTSGNTALKPDTQPEAQSNVVPFNRQQTQFNIEDLEVELRKIADQNLPKSKEKSEVLKLSKIFNYNPKDVGEQLQNIKNESEEENDLETLKEELNELLKNKKQFLNTKEYLPGNLAVVGEFANRLCLRPEVALTALITATSSLLPVGSKIHLSGYTDFDQPMGIYAAIIAEPSQQKSPLINKIVLEPFLELYEEERQKYEQEKLNFDIDYQEWQDAKDFTQPKPKPPEMKYPFATGLTQAGLRTRLDKQAKLGAGMLLLVDEFSGALRSTSKNHNIGLIEDLLSAYDGYGRFEALKEGFASENPECLLSLLGGIQPGVIQEFMNGHDTNGFWSRLTIVNQPVTPFLIPDNPPAKLILKPMLVDFYKKISKLPKLNLRLEPTAEKTFHRLNNEAELSRVNAKNQALASLWGKIRGKIGRYTALLHIIEQVWRYGTVQDSVVSTETLLKGAALATFYYNESQVLYANCTKGDLSKPLAAILDIAEKLKQPLAARVMQQKDREFAAMDVNDIRQMFSQLAQMGHGSVIGSGTRLKFLANFTQTVDIVDNCRQTVDSETTTTQGLQPIVDSVDKKIKISTEPNPLKPLDEQGTVGNSKNNETVENLSTVSTIPSNTHTTGDTASTVPSTVVYNVYSSDCGERSPEPETEPLDFDNIKEGDILFDTHGQPHKITGRTRQLWETHRKQYISRNDISTGQFHRATIEDITTLIKRTIKGKNKNQAQWLCSVYGDSSDSLMAKSLANNDSLIEIYDFDYWE